MNKQGFYNKLPLEEKKKILKQCLVAVDKEQKEVIKKSKTIMNHCLNCNKECKNKFCSHKCHQYYFNHNEEYKKAFIDKIKRGRRLAEKEKK